MAFYFPYLKATCAPLLYLSTKPIQMKYLLISLLICCLSCSGDKNEEDFIPVSVSNLLGTWELTDTKISPGGEVDWSPAEEKDSYTFRIDGTYTYENDLEEESVAGGYAVLNNLITITYITKEQDTISRNYYFQISATELILDYEGCIEACSLRYRKLE